MQEPVVTTTPVSSVEPERQNLKASDYSNYEFDLGLYAKKEEVVLERTAENASADAIVMPILSIVEPKTSDYEDILYTLRHFHLGDPSTNEKTEMAGKDYVPALLHAYRDMLRVRYDYPLFLETTDSVEANAEQLAKPISNVLPELVESFAPGAEAARILKDNLPRIERELRQKLKEEEGPVAAIPLLTEVRQTIQKELGLNEENNIRLQADLDKLLDVIPRNGQLLGYGRYVAIHLLNHTIRSRIIPRRERFHAKIRDSIQILKTLLDVDWHKSDESIEPKMVVNTVGTASSRFDSIALSNVMDHYSRGSIIMSVDRHERIVNALKVLEEYLQEEDPILIRMVHPGGLSGTWLENTPALKVFSDPDPSATATKLFDQQTVKMAKVFAAVRIAQLEIDGIYDTLIHNPWFANFTWEAFSTEEILLLPAVIALESADRIAGQSMTSLSRLLSSGRPIHILVRIQEYNDPHALPNEDPFFNYRLELGYLGLSHRQAVISQSSAARHKHLLERFLLALDATHTSSLHIINTGVQHSVYGINAWLIAGAALESRAHPFFYINPEAGDSFADRMDFTGNPQPELDWPSHSFQYRNTTGEIITTDLAFTFADYVLLVPSLLKHFRLVPIGYDSDELVPVDVYLSAQQEETFGKQVPFIWAVNNQGELRKLVVSRALVFACRDRLNFWHTLQELAGINNKYVDIALQKARAEIQAEEQATREQLEAEHLEKLEQVRNETAGNVMQHLTDVLPGMDLTAPSQLPSRAPVTSAPTAKQAAEEPVTETAEVEAVAEEDEIVFDDPWIDSDLCTSCNDCLNINTVLFVYNDSKQAVFGDLNSGTYAQLVEGAEICPVKCIHPGKPRNPNEPGLEELVKRAEPFNKL